MSDPNRVVVKYEVANRLRRDVYENGKKKVEEYSRTKEDGTQVWSPIVTINIDRMKSIEVE